MAIYHPIDCGVQFRVSISNLDRLVYDGTALQADFFIPEQDHQRLRVTFSRVEIVRTADEFVVSVEDDAKATGLVGEHFAYLVEGSQALETQFSVLTMSRPASAPPLRHYQFITGWTCLDVISAEEPSFDVVDGESSSALSHHPTPVVRQVGEITLHGHGLGMLGDGKQA